MFQAKRCSAVIVVGDFLEKCKFGVFVVVRWPTPVETVAVVPATAPFRISRFTHEYFHHAREESNTSHHLHLCMRTRTKERTPM